MHRRTYTLRRFGDLSFGLGYFEDGVWIDHTMADDAARPAETDPDRGAFDAIHSWFGCCAGDDADVGESPRVVGSASS